MSLPRAEEWVDPGSMDPPRRPGRRALFVVACALGLLVVLAWLWHATRLLGLPDIGPPFDLDALGKENLPEAENAFTYYEAAFEKLIPTPPGRGAGRYVSWAQTPQRDRDWMLANREAMRIWLAGTTKDRAALREPRETRTGADLVLAVRMRTLIRLAQLAALRMEGHGDLDEAWVWHRAALRSTRHCGMVGTFAERSVGADLFGQVTTSIRNWADHPHVTADMLRRAIDDVRAIDAMTPPLSQAIQSEYVALTRLLEDDSMTVAGIARITNGAEPDGKDRRAWALRKFTRREPERSRRTARLIVANWLAVADLPDADRQARRLSSSKVPLYRPPDAAPESARRIGPEALSRWLDSTDLLKVALPPMADMERTLADEAATRDILSRHLTEQLDLREHGRPLGGSEGVNDPR